MLFLIRITRVAAGDPDTKEGVTHLFSEQCLTLSFHQNTNNSPYFNAPSLCLFLSSHLYTVCSSAPEYHRDRQIDIQGQNKVKLLELFLRWP